MIEKLRMWLWSMGGRIVAAVPSSSTTGDRGLCGRLLGVSDPFVPGDPVLMRVVYGGRVRWALPHRFVGTDGSRLALYRGPGNAGKWMRRDPDGRYLERWVSDDEPFDFVWHRTHVLSLVDPFDAHTVELFWDEAWTFLGWYVNLQAPLRRTTLGFDTTDWALDVWVEPDGSWNWKDEDDFAEAISLGVFDEAGAAGVRAEGEKVIAAQPWPTGWEAWRPSDAWQPLPLPEAWATLE
jgi:hypothetical protein